MAERTTLPWSALALVWIAAIGLLLQLRADAQPVPLVDAPDARVGCLSYAPYRRPGESPLVPDYHVPRERIEEDLKRLSTRTRCVRTYSVQQGLDQVPSVAQALGMTVLLGIWINGQPEMNRAELDRAVPLANRYAGTISGLVVGNEVLLRRELPADLLAQWIDEARRRVSVPVTYADVWEFWERNTALADKVSFVTIHILPYWEDDPVGIDLAIRHIGDVHRRMQEHFPGRSLLIGESGWPSAGRMRRAARPGLVEQARFHREFQQAAREQGWRYNLIEAFDQPWKRRLEGAMGGAWGVFDSDGQAKFPATGPVAADPQPGQRLLGGVLAAALAGMLGWVAMAGRGRWSGRGLPGQATAGQGAAGQGAAGQGAAGQGAAYRMTPGRAMPGWPSAMSLALPLGLSAGLLAVLQWRYLLTWARDPMEVGAIGSIMLAGMALAVLTLWRSLGDREIGERQRRLHARLQTFVLFGLAVVAVLLAFDARYRGFPTVLYGLPLLALLLDRRLALPKAPVRLEHRLLAVIALAGLAVSLWIEGFQNREAWMFAVVGCALIYLAATPWRSASRDSATTPSRLPTAAGSNE